MMRNLSQDGREEDLKNRKTNHKVCILLLDNRENGETSKIPASTPG